MCGEPMVGVAFIVDELEFYQTPEHAAAAYCHLIVKRADRRSCGSRMGSAGIVCLLGCC